MLFMWVPLHNKLYNSRVVRFWNVMVSWFCVRPGTSLRWLWRRIQKTMKHDPLSYIGLFVHSNFLGPSGPQVIVWSEVWRSQHFPPIRDSKFQWSWAFKLYCKVALNRQTLVPGDLVQHRLWRGLPPHAFGHGLSLSQYIHRTLFHAQMSGTPQHTFVPARRWGKISIPNSTSIKLVIFVMRLASSQ